jgi:WD40 repeat protein
VSWRSSCPRTHHAAAAAGGDGSIKLFHTLRAQPLLVLQPGGAALFSVRWSSSRPFVFAASAGDGRVYFYDLLAAQRLLAPVLVLVQQEQGRQPPEVEGAAGAAAGVGPGKQQGPVYAIEFCGADGGLFAASSGRGTQVWRLPAELSDAAAGEVGLFGRVMSADDVMQALREEEGG